MANNSESYLAKYEGTCRAVDSLINPNIAYLINDEGTGFTILDTYRRDEIELEPEELKEIRKVIGQKGSSVILKYSNGTKLKIEIELADLIREGIEIMDFLGDGIYFYKPERRRVG